MNLRKIIKEELEKVLDKQKNQEKFGQDIVYLKGFSLNKKEEKSESIVWIFDHNEKDYTIRFYIQKNKKTDIWKTKVFIYWKTPSKEFTNAKGKDFELPFGPFSSYEEMVKELNRKLQNHPNISSKNYMDDDNTQFDRDLSEMIKLMLKKVDKINAVKDEYFKDLKKLYNQVKDIKTPESLKGLITKIAPDEEDKQTLLLTIQKIYLLDFFLNKEEMESLF